MERDSNLFDFPQFDLDEYEECEALLGEGSFGKVVQVINLKTNQIFAQKEISFSEENKYIKREIYIMSTLQNPCLCPLIGINVDQDDNILHILLPYMKNGSLDKVIKSSISGKKIDWWDITTQMKALYGIAVGMAYMHSKKVIHRDLKPGNVLLDDNYEVKITDFGSSRFCANCESSRTLSVGTPSYMAPEIITSNNYDEKVDVYSYAITMYELLLKRPAFHYSSSFKLFTLVINGNRPQMDKSTFPYGDGFFNLLQKCWSPIPSVRPSFNEILDIFPTILPRGIDLEKFHDYVNRVNPDALSKFPTKDIDLKKCSSVMAPSGRKESTFEIPEIELISDIQNGDQEKKDPEQNNKVIHSCKSCPNEINATMVSTIKTQAEMGNAKELLNYGLLLYCGDDEVEKDIPQAISFIKRAAEKDNIDAIYWLGIHYFEGIDEIEIDMEKAREYLKKAADNDHLLAQFFYGFICDRGSECYPAEIDPNHATHAQKHKYEWKVDKKEGFYYTKMAADKGHSTSALIIARKYESGIVSNEDSNFSLPKNEEMATKYYKIAADSGDVSSMIKFAKRADIGRGMKCDPNLAIRYMKLASDSGEMHGMYYYGFYLLNGKNGCKQNLKLAVDLIKKAADKGLPEARTLYANMLRTGFECVEKNEELAKKYENIKGH